jgi:cytochrome c551/c552
MSHFNHIVIVGIALHFGHACIAEGQTPESLARRVGCFECHSRYEHVVGPAFSDIATRYNADVFEFDLRLMSVGALSDLPRQSKSTVIVARVDGQVHIRIFDSLGMLVVDKPEAKLKEAKGFENSSGQLKREPVPDGSKLAADERRRILDAVQSIAGYTREDRRASLIRTIRQGGKGHWTAISKGVPMPSFGGRLNDEEIGRLVDWILGGQAGVRLRVMTAGLGAGRVTSNPPGIDCPADCEETFAAGTAVTLTATADPGSEFVRWVLDPNVTANTLTVTMNAPYSVRAEFRPATPIPPLAANQINPAGIAVYLAANPAVDTVAKFLHALPREFRQNWILMSRSESLQTGTAKFPRILLPSKDAQNVFTLGVAVHSAYPGAHPNAIEYMQWDAADKNFRFHEIVVADIPAMHPITQPDGTVVHTFPVRPRDIVVDDAKCTKCHSTQNVLNRSSFPGTTGVTPPFTIKAKSKPNWDTYDSWGGEMPLNRDRVYSGSLEAAALRAIFDPWTWQAVPSVRAVFEQLELQPPGVPDGSGGTPDHRIIQIKGGEFDGHIRFGFDPSSPVVTEPEPVGDAPPISTNYSFDAKPGTGPATPVIRGGQFVTLHHSETPTSDEGRAVQLFDLLGGLDGDFNAQRVADELIEHRFATGSVPIDVRPVTLAIASGLLEIDDVANKVRAIAGLPALTIDSTFFDQRNGMQIMQLRDDTSKRAKDLPRRKADIQRINLDRAGDVYLRLGDTTKGLVLEYGAKTFYGVDVALGRLRQEVFRRPIDVGSPDSTVMGGIYVDRELYSYNTHRIAMFRYFLEPLGVSVDKWSMGVRGRSRTYTFADVFGTYTNVLQQKLRDSLHADPRGTGLPNPFTDAQLIAAVNQTLSVLPSADAIPKFTDVQRVFNKSCIECHGGLNYPPYVDFGTSIDLSENEAPPTGSRRLDRAHAVASLWTTSVPATSKLYQRLINPSEDCGYATGVQMMPCGGPSLSPVDIETIRRWIIGGRPYSVGDPHIRTIDGTTYDFQAAGEFIALRGENLEVQVRQTAVGTDGLMGPDPHTALTSSVSINTAVAIRVAQRRITYQPAPGANSDAAGLQLRVDGKPIELPAEGLAIGPGARIIRTIARGGIQVEAPSGTAIIITPGFWEHFQVWYLNIDTRHVRATEGLMGAIAPGNWLPALPDGREMGTRPADLQQRRHDLYEEFGNSWRVTDATSLFDYEPGKSTKSYTVADWPTFDAKASHVPPPGPGTAGQKGPAKGLTLEEATQLSAQIVDPALRAHCIQDVMVTGNKGFVDTYLTTDRIRRNAPPIPPLLVFPEDQARNLDNIVKFVWRPSTDPEGEAIAYRLYIWPTSVLPDNNQAVPVAAIEVSQLASTVVSLQPRQSYYWKVIADDGKGRTVESTTNRFQTR